MTPLDEKPKKWQTNFSLFFCKSWTSAFLLFPWILLVSTCVWSVQNRSQNHHLFLKSVSHTLSRCVTVDTQRWTCQVCSGSYSLDGLDWDWKCVWTSRADSLAYVDHRCWILWKCNQWCICIKLFTEPHKSIHTL